MSQRPNNFGINYQSPLAKGLVFAGLGRHPRSIRYTDSSLFKSTGTLTNMSPATDWVFDPYLGRWVLDYVTASSQYTSLPLTSAKLGSRFSCAVWVKPTSTSESVWFGGPLTQWAIYSWNLGFSVYIGGASKSSSKTLSLNTWSHLAFTFDDTNDAYAIYYNGALAASGAWTATPTAGTGSALGRNGTTSNYYATAQLCDPLAYGRILSLPEIQTLANPADPMLGGLILPPARKWWPIFSAAGPVFLSQIRDGRRTGVGGGYGARR